MDLNRTLSHEEIVGSLKPFPVGLLKIYPRSFSFLNGLMCGLIRTSGGKRLVLLGEKNSLLSDSFKGEILSGSPALKICDLSSENTEALMALFPFTQPRAILKYPFTLGTGDRLGVATPGHIRAIRKFQVRPVFAQQSVRENTQTGRDFNDVVRDAAWAVFQENYREGYGADGDHLKSLGEIENALDAGVSMITLDLSERLDPEAFKAPVESINRKYKDEIGEEESKVLFHLFMGKEFHFQGPQGECRIRYDEESVKRNALLYRRALDFTEEVYQFIRARTGNRPSVDFEVSIDETPFPTPPENHLFFVIEMNQRGIRIDSLAPRFIGEFQKGIDYRGDLTTFRDQFAQHALIAQHYGSYKLSIHSGSDKFSVFPDVGRLAKDGFHLKTAGTSWLEAMRLIAMKAPALFREMHQVALTSFTEASKLYHVTTDLNRIPSLETLQDRNLPELLDQEDARQLLHITYGFLLKAKDRDGRDLFRSRFYQTLAQFEEDYGSLLERHIKNHLNSLGVAKGET
jgi:tagaturonate epimerase